MRRLAFLLLLLVAAPAMAARLTGLTMTPGTITISADGPPAVAWQFALSGPDRLVVDIPAVLDAPLAAPGAGSVKALRAAMFAPGVARLVIELSAPLAIVEARNRPDGLVITLRRVGADEFAAALARGRRPLPVNVTPPTAPGASGAAGTPGSPAAPPPATDFALPADLFPDRPGASPPVAAAATAPLPEAAVDPKPPPRRRAPGVRPRSGGLPLVVIDAGHGGKDVGAISIDGRHEKDVTLAIARAAAAELRKSGKVRVRLTRDTDIFIPLGGRVSIARQARADLFISIHADSAGNPAARGASVYTLSAVASDAVAARLAARENKADIIGGINLGQVAPDVGDIMIDLSRRATTNISVAFADILQETLADDVGFRSQFHHFAGFVVLKAPDVPSVLLETGYLSNQEDADRLFSSEGRRALARGIARAAERHLLGE